MIIDNTYNYQTREQVLKALESHPVHSIPPVGDPYVWGRWHKHRASVKGYIKEALAATGAIFKNNQPSKLIVFARPRSGTTLLGHLLGQVPDIHDDRESLHHAVLSPLRFLENRARGCGKRGYVSKLLSYQMFEVQYIRDPLRFFESLTQSGFILLHLRRRTYDQALSLSTAQTTKQYFLKSNESAEPKRCSIQIDPERFVEQVRWNLEMLSFEDELMKSFPHRTIQYENDLLKSTIQQETIDAICSDLRLQSFDVRASLRRTGGHSGKFYVKNEKELKTALERNGLGHVIEETI